MAEIRKVDTAIIGAGLIGSSVAMHLVQMGLSGGEGVRVADFDLEGALSSSELNAGGVRATWNQPINIEMSRLSIEYFAKHADDVGYRACGYLWMHGPEKWERALAARDRQLSHGWPVEVWDPAELSRRVPFIDKTSDLAGALFAPRDGLVNSNLLKIHFRNEAKKLGAQFEDRLKLKGATFEADGQIRLVFDQFDRPMTVEEKLGEIGGGVRQAGIQPREIVWLAKRVVNCAGPWASEVARILGYLSPSYPLRRQICLFDCRDVDLTPYGMMIDPSGVYFHPEASNGLAGFATPDEQQGINYHYDGESFFEEIVWPALYERSTHFERLRHVTGWAGLYEVSPDESSILGQVMNGEAGRSGRVFEAHSFSGHGAMHSYAAGQALAEWMIKGKYISLDALPLNAHRFETGALIRESLVI